jgi:hypothetical protein
MQKGFFGSLFDLSFGSLVTPKVVKFLYVLTLIAIGLIALLFIIGAFARNSAFGALTLLVIAPALSLLYAVYARVILELIVALFRLVEYNGELVALKRQQMTGDTGGPSAPG